MQTINMVHIVTLLRVMGGYVIAQGKKAIDVIGFSFSDSFDLFLL
jgi:hypothetical protein